MDDLNVHSFASLYDYLEPGQLVHGDVPEEWRVPWNTANAGTWAVG